MAAQAGFLHPLCRLFLRLAACKQVNHPVIVVAKEPCKSKDSRFSDLLFNDKVKGLQPLKQMKGSSVMAAVPPIIAHERQ